MTYTSLMVHCELGQSNATVLQCAGDLAERFELRVVGIAVAQPIQMMYGDYYISADSVEGDSKEIEAKAAVAEAAFRLALQSRVRQLSWRWTRVFGASADYVSQQARAADLVMTAAPTNSSDVGQRSVNMGDLVLQAGRPVLIVPATPCSNNFEHILIGWKDTREARRAVVDALPLLKKAAHITVVQIAAESNLADARKNLDDLAHWLKGHGIDAETIASQSSGHDAKSFSTIAQRQRADLVVAGAYGHSRLREWAFGGFTTELMQPQERCSFVSH